MTLIKTQAQHAVTKSVPKLPVLGSRHITETKKKLLNLIG